MHLYVLRIINTRTVAIYCNTTLAWLNSYSCKPKDLDNPEAEPCSTLLLLMVDRMIYNVQVPIALEKATEATKEKEAINGEEGSVSD
jgi:hypothetical protein